ncbi:MAG: exodeoxyribonuclease VII small subunit [Caldilineaceae bacterium]|nr:exodeoxyribonuclease VII small subunit [Caldilineaceae bacterium]
MAQKKKESLDGVSYEDAYARLQAVLAQLENGDTPLQESLALYAQGTQLAAHCAAQLEEAELTVRRWQEQGGTTAFTEWREE